MLFYCGHVMKLHQHVASYPWITYIHGYPIAAMDMMDGHGNRYILVVTSHPSHGQNSTNRLYLPMDMPPIPWIGTKYMEKPAKCATNIDPIPTPINTI